MPKSARWNWPAADTKLRCRVPTFLLQASASRGLVRAGYVVGAVGALVLALSAAALLAQARREGPPPFREIGARFFLSRNTVKTQAISVYRKLGASSRSEAVVRAYSLGLIDQSADAGALIRIG